MKKRFLSLFVLFFLGVATSLWAATPLKKVSVLIDNDFCGDPDGLFALAQQVLEPSTHIVGIVGGHLNSNAGSPIAPIRPLSRWRKPTPCLT